MKIQCEGLDHQHQLSKIIFSRIHLSLPHPNQLKINPFLLLILISIPIVIKIFSSSLTITTVKSPPSIYNSTPHENTTSDVSFNDSPGNHTVSTNLYAPTPPSMKINDILLTSVNSKYIAILERLPIFVHPPETI